MPTVKRIPNGRAALHTYRNVGKFYHTVQKVPKTWRTTLLELEPLILGTGNNIFIRK